MEEGFTSKNKWWWKYIWDVKAPNKTKNILWMAMDNKILTWDHGIKRGWCGPNRFSLCKSNS
jgi:hypothetical protein